MLRANPYYGDGDSWSTLQPGTLVLTVFYETWKYICILSFLNTEMVQAVEILPCGRRSVCFTHTFLRLWEYQAQFNLIRYKSGLELNISFDLIFLVENNDLFMFA